MNREYAVSSPLALRGDVAELTELSRICQQDVVGSSLAFGPPGPRIGKMFSKLCG